MSRHFITDWGFNYGQVTSGTTWSLSGGLGTSAFSVACWVRPTLGDHSGAYWYVLGIGKMIGSILGQFSIQTDQPAGGGGARYNAVVNDLNTVGCQQAISNVRGDLDIGQWHHILVTRSAKDFRMYIDGREDYKFTNNSALVGAAGVTLSNTSTVVFDVGNSPLADAVGAFTGDAAEAGVWTTALTANEAARLPFVRPYLVQPSSLKVYWPLNAIGAAAMTTELDLSGNGQNGTVSGAGTFSWKGAPSPLTNASLMQSAARASSKRFDSLLYTFPDGDAFFGDLHWFSTPIFPVVPAGRVFPRIPTQRVSPIVSTNRNRGPY